MRIWSHLVTHFAMSLSFQNWFGLSLVVLNIWWLKGSSVGAKSDGNDDDDYGDSFDIFLVLRRFMIERRFVCLFVCLFACSVVARFDWKVDFISSFSVADFQVRHVNQQNIFILDWNAKMASSIKLLYSNSLVTILRAIAKLWHVA